MIEESFVRMYAHDFKQLAGRSELGQDVDDALTRRLCEARAHAVLMDQRKGSDHLAALVGRLRDEAGRFVGRPMLKDADPVAAAVRHQRFLTEIADVLAEPEGERRHRAHGKPGLQVRRLDA
jgi:plasmid stabilization system protein ParE